MTMARASFGFLDGTALKMIALITMIIDHVGAIFFPYDMSFRIVGRLAMPIFVFLLVQGFKRTGDMKAYLRRLLGFAFVSELAFDMAFYGTFFETTHQNIMFSLALSLIVLIYYDRFYSDRKYIQALLVLVVGCYFGELLNFDYGSMIPLIAVLFYLYSLTDEPIRKAIFIVIFVLVNFSGIQTYACLALIPIFFYNYKRGAGFKYLFYIAYPGHLALLFLIKLALVQGIISLP